MRKLVLLGAVAALAAPSSASAADRHVAISGSSFQPGRALALLEEKVVWTNHDLAAAHNVTFPDGVRSPDLARGQIFERTFTSAGTFAYHCTLHAGMRGTVSVAALHLSGPATPVRYGATATFTGLAPENSSVELQRVTTAGMETVVSTTAGANGAFRIALAAKLPGQYHATAGGRTSALVRLKVRPRVVVATRRSRGAFSVNVSTTPSQAGAPVVLQRRTSSGWARLASARLSSRSHATFRVVPRATMKLRVQLTRGVHGFSPSTSATITVRP